MIAIVYLVSLVVLTAFWFVRALDARIERERNGAAFPSARTRRRS